MNKCSYNVTLTDLVIKWPSSWIDVIARWLTFLMKPLTLRVGVVAGLSLLFVTSIYSTLIMPVQSTVDTLFHNAWGVMIIVIVWQLGQENEFKERVVRLSFEMAW